MRIEVAGDSHIGMKRTTNEDAFLLSPEANLVVVADGMGGHACGEVAAGLAIESIRSFFDDTSGDREITWPHRFDESRPFPVNRLLGAMRRANDRIFALAQQDEGRRGMGTTAVSLLVTPEASYVSWAGDSRAYRFRAGKLELLTEDHSLLNDLIKASKLTPADVEAFPHKNVIVRALGLKPEVEVDLREDEPQDGDVYLLCSDGLTTMVSDETIAEVLTRAHDLERAVGQLIDAANAAGGRDNVTVVLARCLQATQRDMELPRVLQPDENEGS